MSGQEVAHGMWHMINAVIEGRRWTWMETKLWWTTKRNACFEWCTDFEFENFGALILILWNGNLQFEFWKVTHKFRSFDTGMHYVTLGGHSHQFSLEVVLSQHTGTDTNSQYQLPPETRSEINIHLFQGLGNVSNGTVLQHQNLMACSGHADGWYHMKSQWNWAVAVKVNMLIYFA